MKTSMAHGCTLGELIATARRETATRRKNFPDLVTRGSMFQGDADYEIGAMEAIEQLAKDVFDRDFNWMKQDVLD